MPLFFSSFFCFKGTGSRPPTPLFFLFIKAAGSAASLRSDELRSGAGGNGGRRSNALVTWFMSCVNQRLTTYERRAVMSQKGTFLPFNGFEQNRNTKGRRAPQRALKEQKK